MAGLPDAPGAGAVLGAAGMARARHRRRAHAVDGDCRQADVGRTSRSGIQLLSSKLTVVAHGLTGIPKEQFPEVAKEAEGKCPVSNAYRGSMTIALDAKAV